MITLKKIITCILLLMLTLSSTQIVFAGNTADESLGAGTDTEGTGTDTSTDATDDAGSSDTGLDSFSVGTFLTIEGEQDQSYFDEEESSAPLVSFILTIIDFLTKVIGTACMVLIIIGGLLMVASEGDDNRVQKGKSIITQAVIGLIIALTSYVLVTFVQSLLYVSS